MPKKTGFGFLEDLKKDPNLKSIPIMIISQLGQPEDIDKGVSLGAIEYFVKARISLDDLVARVKKFVEEKRAGSSNG